MNQPFLHAGLRFNTFVGEGDGEIIYFQHGLCGSAMQTQEAFPTDPRYRLATLECRGHGLSEAGDPNQFSIANFADDVAATMDQPAIVGGISMGAAIALHLAVHRPHLVKALVLARPAWLTDAAPANMRANREVGELLVGHDPATAKQEFLAGETARHLAIAAPDNLASLLTFFDRQPIPTTSALLRSISQDGPGVSQRDLSHIKVPTLIIATEQDVIHPLVHARALHAAIPQSRLVHITPKAVDKSRYLSEFQSALLKFFGELNAKSS